MLDQLANHVTRDPDEGSARVGGRRLTDFEAARLFGTFHSAARTAAISAPRTTATTALAGHVLRAQPVRSGALLPTSPAQWSRALRQDKLFFAAVGAVEPEPSGVNDRVVAARMTDIAGMFAGIDAKSPSGDHLLHAYVGAAMRDLDAGQRQNVLATLDGVADRLDRNSGANGMDVHPVNAVRAGVADTLGQDRPMVHALT